LFTGLGNGFSAKSQIANWLSYYLRYDGPITGACASADGTRKADGKDRPPNAIRSQRDISPVP
jgi:hypothetical protein